MLDFIDKVIVRLLGSGVIDCLMKLQQQVYEYAFCFQDSCTKLQAEEDADKNYSVLDLFRSPHLRKMTILLILIWMAISLVFDGHVRNVGSLGLDLFLTFTVASATEFPADTFLTLVLDRWGRRWLSFFTMVFSGLFSLAAAAVPSGIKQHKKHKFTQFFNKLLFYLSRCLFCKFGNNRKILCKCLLQYWLTICRRIITHSCPSSRSCLYPHHGLRC